MVYIDTLGRRVLLLAGMVLYSILFRWFMSVVRENVGGDSIHNASYLVKLCPLNFCFLFTFFAGCALMGLAWLFAAICVYIATSPELLHISLLEDHHSKMVTYYAVCTTQFLFGASLCVYSFSFALSIGSVFWVYCSEIFPYRTRAKAATVTMCSYFLSSMCNTSLHHLSLAGVGIWGTFHSSDSTGADSNGGDSVEVDPIIEYKHHHHRHHHKPSSTVPGSLVYSGVYNSDYSFTQSRYSGLYNTLYKSIFGGGDVFNNTINTDSSVSRSLRHVYTSSPYIVDDDRATLFIMHLAVVSILMGLFVYYFVPETKGTICLVTLWHTVVVHLYNIIYFPSDYRIAVGSDGRIVPIGPFQFYQHKQ